MNDHTLKGSARYPRTTACTITTQSDRQSKCIITIRLIPLSQCRTLGTATCRAFFWHNGVFVAKSFEDYSTSQCRKKSIYIFPCSYFPFLHYIMYQFHYQPELFCNILGRFKQFYFPFQKPRALARRTYSSSFRPI